MIVRRIKPQHRLKAIWALASKRNICEPDMLDEDQGDATNEADFGREQAAPAGHGGCGAEQPVWRKEGLKLTAVIRAPPPEKGEVSIQNCHRIVRAVLLTIVYRNLERPRNVPFRLERSTMCSKRSRAMIYTSWGSMPNTRVQTG